MVLHFYTAALESKTLQELFGLSATTFSRVLHKAEEALSVALKAMKDARIQWPSKKTQALWASKTQEREPLVTGVFALVDGKNFRVQIPTNADLKNAQYNGLCACHFTV
ncbi:hypothetical protein H310_07789 [Aphanomyces invadans]|uniref:DDE Tnp4 domain-containing protein n=1 Tax=Aphanomyces invadans TaxID=157072 RepID=A0A024U1F4_9STRA|nr:hypothetical protein H310_07789 [Aphanomyces invadans]ETV99731.1 hypothetical protein H310_07789 [Aphanomyces invadans]|eukprot:XP_008871507.1 hypothetical protein H310_07789 [Aphanomyces invadans]